MNKLNASSDLGRREEMLTAWADQEASIVRKNSSEYDLEWGRLREEFYDKVGSVPLPSTDVERLASLKDRYKGERIFIIGNGPSINRTPLNLLKNEYTFGVNRIYLLYDRIEWKPTFYTALDWRVVPDTAREINALTGSTFFFEERFRGLLREGEDVHYYTHSAASSDHPEEKLFAQNVARGVRGAGSVIGTAIQLAYHMGFDPIYLIGCDLGYKVPDTVTQEGEDRFGNGVKLHLTSTEDDDANHFDPRYFGKGRRWHDPNVKRMIEGHKQCKHGIESAGRHIYNATMGGELEVYPRKHFITLFPDRVMKPLTRERCAHVDETAVVAHLTKDRIGPQHVMLDVGAHQGTSAVYFDKQAWSIHCFEPDRNNRARLLKRFGQRENLFIDPRAVSDAPALGVSFFTSDESSGISGLHAFRDTHKESDKVDVTTVDEIASSRGLSNIDFLKIDVEGFDLNVLKGVPWGRLKPDIVECEFEDAKTEKMGHTWRDVAEYLRLHGYTVYLSEWHPIVKYGIPHDWKRVVPYPGIDMSTNSWGNILAFRKDPGYDAVVQAFEHLLTYRSSSEESKKSTEKLSNSAPSAEPLTKEQSMPNSPSRDDQSNVRGSRVAGKNGSVVSAIEQPRTSKNAGKRRALEMNMSAAQIQTKLPIQEVVSTSPGLPGLKKFIRTAVNHASLRRKWMLPLSALSLVTLAIILLPAFSEYRLVMFSGALAIILGGGLLYVAFRSQSHAHALHLRTEALDETCKILNHQITQLKQANASVAIENLTQHENVVEQIESQMSSLKNLSDPVSRLSASVPKLESQVQNLNSKSKLLPELSSDLQDARSQISQLRTMTNSVGSRTTSAQERIEDTEQSLRAIVNELERLDSAIQSTDALLTSRSEASEKRFEDEFERLDSAIQSTDARLTSTSEATEEMLSDSATRISSLDSSLSDLQSSTEAIGIQLNSSSDAVEKRISAIDDDIETIRADLVSYDEKYTALPEMIDDANAKIDDSFERAETTERWMIFNNAEWFQTFNRRLDAKHISTLERQWRKRLSIPMNKFALSYEADSLCEIERRLHGRLATSVEDFLLRLAVAKAVKGERIDILEIGVLFGIDIAAMYNSLSINFEQVHFTLLDPLDGYYRSGQSDGLTGVPISEKVLRDNMQRVGMSEDNFTLIPQLSTELDAIERAAKTQYDLLVIDGDHSYAGVKADFENYARTVKLGGYIIFDDYGSDDWPDVQQYVDDEVAKSGFVSKVGHSWRTAVYRVVKPVK